MEKFKFGLFDIFTYTLPGMVFMFSLFLYFYNVDISLIVTFKNILLLTNNLSLSSIVILFIISYIVGFILDWIGYKYFHYIGKRIWAKTINNEMKSLTNSDLELVLARHYSKENFIYIVQWYAFRGMSFNLSLAFLFLTTILVLKIMINSMYQMEWLILSFTCLCSSIVLLRKSVKYHIWSHNTMFETVFLLFKDKITSIDINSLK